jgi:hypothetical protein
MRNFNFVPGELLRYSFDIRFFCLFLYKKGDTNVVFDIESCQIYTAFNLYRPNELLVR